MEQIMQLTENIKKPTICIDPNGDDFAPRAGRIFVDSPAALKTAIDCSHVYGRSCPTMGTIIYQIDLDKGWEDELEAVFILTDWWAKELRDQFSGSRKLSLCLPDLKSYVTNNSAPPKFRQLLTKGRHLYRMHFDTQGPTHQPRYIIGNSIQFSVFQFDMEDDIKRISKDINKNINVDTMPQLKEFEFFHYNKKKKELFISKF